jgi:hypothetical protein
MYIVHVVHVVHVHRGAYLRPKTICSARRGTRRVVQSWGWGGGRLRGKPAYICPKPETSPPDVAILVLLPSAELCHPPSSSVGFILFLINSVSCS